MMRRYCLAAAMMASFLVAVAFTGAAQANATNSTVSDVTVRPLAQSPAMTLPAGKIFVTVLEFSQVPGAACGPTCYLPGFVYTLRGVASISLPGAASGSIGPGNAAFTPTLTVHTNDNVGGRAGAVAIAIGLIVVAIVLCASTWLRSGRRRAIISVLSLLLIGGGVLGLSGATSNDWYYIAVRSAAVRVQPMPRPDGRVTYLSPDVAPEPAGPYIESLRAITIPPGAQYQSADATGPQMIIVTDGAAAIDIGGQTTHLGVAAGAFAQTGQTLAIANPGSDTLQVLDFALTPLQAGSAAP
jgi:hypothetical protein